MNSLVFTDGKGKPVKNLGWLLRHSSEVVRIRISSTDPRNGECVLSADLEDSRMFKSYFASRSVCEQWVKRPSLRHAEITLSE